MIVRRSGSILVITLAAGFAAARADITTGLVGHWKMDDEIGTVATDSVGGNEGALRGDATWDAGFLGGAVLLDGDGDYIDCGNKDAFNITDAVTLAAWLQADGDFSYPDWSGIIMRGGANIDTFALYYNGPSAQLGFKTTGATPEWFASGANTTPMLFDGEWHHVAATYDGAMKTIYVDGEPRFSLATTGKIETSSGRLLIGAGRDLTPPTHFVAGRIDEARLYRRALSAADVKEFFPPRLQAYKPDPADGAAGVTSPIFRWTAGDTAALHRVYIGTSPDLGPDDLGGDPMPVPMFFYMSNLEPGAQYYWRVDEVEADGTTVHTGNVWTFIVQDLAAYYPTPADGAADASPAPTLTWAPGQGALGHHVYFSDNLDAVAQGTADADQGESDGTSFTPGTLDPATTYYWRVDERKSGDAVEPGAVWSFTTYLPIEDFESYTDEEGSRIYQTWIDGYTNGRSGSTVGYIEAPFAEQNIVHGGGQSMPLDYNNIESPFYSEAERDFSPAQDWTINGINTLVVYLRGRVTNGSMPAYVAVEDSSGNMGTVVYPEPAITATAKWVEWKVPFSAFTAEGVNMARVERLYIGVGDPSDPTPGGIGILFVDDIRAIKAAATE